MLQRTGERLDCVNEEARDVRDLPDVPQVDRVVHPVEWPDEVLRVQKIERAEPLSNGHV